MTDKTPRLKSTGERVIIIGTHFNRKTGEDMLKCILPPQSPGHNQRVQNIHREKIKGDIA